jgi:hypothetical protein
MYTNSIKEGKAHKVNEPIINDNIIQMLLQELANIEYERFKELKMKDAQRESGVFHSTQSFNIFSTPLQP